MPEPTLLWSRPALPALHGRRILVVEDEYMVAEDLRVELESMGAEVLGPVPSVARALALLARTSEIDAAILDVNLGSEMVFPVAEALRERRAVHVRHRLRPLVAASGLRRDPPLREAVPCGTLPARAVRQGHTVAGQSHRTSGPGSLRLLGVGSEISNRQRAPV
jgi:CheY-like chemotaxis protein